MDIEPGSINQRYEVTIPGYRRVFILAPGGFI